MTAIRMKYLDPKADLTFKKVFGEHPDLVMSLLNALLPLTPEQEITEVEYLPSELMPDNPMRKYSIVDVRCKDKRGRQFLVEMQMIWSKEFRQRVVLNASKAYARQLKTGEEYKLAEPVYSLNLVNEVFEPQLPGFYHHYMLTHQEHTEKVIEGLELVFVELPKFKPSNRNEKKMQVLWLRYLTEVGEETYYVAPELLENPQVEKAVHELEVGAFNDAQLYTYEFFWDMVSLERGRENRAHEEGLQKGLQKGMEEGMKQGLEQGLQKGMQQALLKTALNMKQNGIDPTVIVACTGFSLEEIEKM